MLETITHTRPGRLRAWLIAGALGLSVKLEWAQQLLAAGENEPAPVLLTSVAESLHSQLQQRHTPHQEPRQ